MPESIELRCTGAFFYAKFFLDCRLTQNVLSFVDLTLKDEISRSSNFARCSFLLNTLSIKQVRYLDYLGTLFACIWPENFAPIRTHSTQPTISCRSLFQLFFAAVIGDKRDYFSIFVSFCQNYILVIADESLLS